MRAWVLVWGWLILGGAGAALGQTARPSAGTQVGAEQIFTVLTRPERASEAAELKMVEAELAGSPDAAKLEAARLHLQDIVKQEAARQGDVPQALVMSQIASRIEAAMEGLEAARAADRASLAGRLRPFAVPGLAVAAGALAAGLVAALLALAARGREQDETGEIRDILAKMRRRLDALSQAPQDGPAPAAAEAEAASAGLQDLVRRVEAKLLAAVDAAGAARAEAPRGGPDDGSAHGMAEEARLDALARCLEAVAGQLGRLETAAARLEEQEAGRRGAGLAPVAAGGADTQDGGFLAGEAAASIELLSELAHVANGQCARLDSLIGQASAAVISLTEAAARAEAPKAAGGLAEHPGAAAALREAAAAAVQQAAGAAGQLHESAGRVMARIETACATLNEAAARLGQASQAALDGTIDMRNETRRFSGQASAAQAAFLAAAREAEDALRLAGEGLARHAQGERDGAMAPGSREMEALRKAIETAQVAALRLQQSASDQEQALSMANEAALEIARLSQRASGDGGSGSAAA